MSLIRFFVICFVVLSLPLLSIAQRARQDVSSGRGRAPIPRERTDLAESKGAKPPPKPSVDFKPYRDQLAAAVQAQQAVRDQCLDLLARESDSYKTARAAMEEQARRYDVAKSSGDLQGRVAASGALNNAKAKVTKIEASALREDPEYQRAVAEREEAAAALKAAEGDLRRRIAEWEVVKADSLIPTMNANRLQAQGQLYVGKRVKVVGCQFYQADNRSVTALPGVMSRSEREGYTAVEVNLNRVAISPRDSGPEAPRGKSAAASWVGFVVADEEGNTLNYLYAVADELGHAVGDLSRGDRVDVYGEVVALELSKSAQCFTQLFQPG